MANADERPIIIKKIKKADHGAHGGAWKVAYADFVTAMMAFFLLLWLLSSTSKSQKEGIADFFTPTVGIRDEMGIGVKGGKSEVIDGSKKEELSPPSIIFGAPPTGELVKNPVQIKTQDPEDTEAFEQTGKEKSEEELAAEKQDSQELDKLEKELEETIKNDAELSQFQENLLIDQTPEGLRIQLVDQKDRSMFKPGSTRLEDFAKIILEKLAPILNHIPNRMSITGHTDATQYGINAEYTNWELSSDRAHVTRRYFLQNTALEKEKIVVVTGKADREPLIPQNREDARNRRISIIMLRKSIYPFDVPAPSELQQAPKPDDNDEKLLKLTP